MGAKKFTDVCNQCNLYPSEGETSRGKCVNAKDGNIGKNSKKSALEAGLENSLAAPTIQTDA